MMMALDNIHAVNMLVVQIIMFTWVLILNCTFIFFSLARVVFEYHYQAGKEWSVELSLGAIEHVKG